ncbi:MAG: NAD-dependent epimerase/dehydratase family protein [Sphingobacteriia bacterium]|jgi:nucleoside-diphosphate-sugar epimerase
MSKILVIGAGGQLGLELLPALAAQYGDTQVVAADLQPIQTPYTQVQLDVTDRENLEAIIRQHGVSQIYLLAAFLSAKGEEQPALAWRVNMNGLMNVLDLSVKHQIQKVFWPSSIAVFGPSSPSTATPQHTVMEPATIYGISKQAGEGLCAWYHRKHGLDVRSLRYPGLISYKVQPGGGTTDYAVHIFYEALARAAYTSFLAADSRLPMMYMPDAVRATLQLMEAPAEAIRVRQSYNLAAISFTPAEIAAAIKAHIPEFQIDYAPDFRQAIASSWPQSIDDSAARADWGWQHEYNLDRMVADMLENMKKLQLAG